MVKGHQGWDIQQVCDVARTHYGDIKTMFIHFGWAERGRAMLPNALGHIKSDPRFGNVQTFVAKHKNGRV